jgi:hypothetical protein
MRAGDINAYSQMATMYTIENAISKKEFENKIAVVLGNSTKKA